MSALKSLFFLLVFALPILAQLEGNPANWCRNGAFPRESSEYKLATIKAERGEKVYFSGDDGENCPDGKNCRLKSYLIPGDEIIVSRSFGKWACGWFQPVKGRETVGWLALEKIEFKETNLKPETREWLGEWKFYESSIKIGRSKKDGFFEIKGSAFWRGLGDNIHIGELDDRARPTGNELKIGEASDGEDECKATMRLVGKYLVVSDNLQCGGANVTFSGVYRRK